MKLCCWLTDPAFNANASSKDAIEMLCAKSQNPGANDTINQLSSGFSTCLPSKSTFGNSHLTTYSGLRSRSWTDRAAIQTP
jgi:hypothetical protein